MHLVLLANYPTWGQSWGPKTQCNSKLNDHITKASTADFGMHIIDF